MSERDMTFVLRIKSVGAAVLTSVKNELEGIRTAAQQVSNAFRPVTSAMGGMVAGFAGFAAIRTAMREATASVEAAERLKIALGDSVAKFDHISQQAEAIASRTVLDDDQILEVADALIQRGVGLGKLGGAIDATVQVSAALRQDLKATAEQISQTFAGVVPRELGRAVPELRALSAESLRAGDAVAVLTRRYAGQAEAMRGTVMGQIALARRDISNAFESIGKVLLPIQARLMNAIVPAIEELSARLSSPPMQAALSAISGVVHLVVSRAEAAMDRPGGG